MEDTPAPGASMEDQLPLALPPEAARPRDLIGFATLGLAAAISTGVGLSSAATLAISVLTPAVVAVTMTLPTLLVGHLMLRLDGRPSSAASAVLRCLTRSGRLALWLGPVLLFFYGGEGVMWGVFLCAVMLVGGVGLSAAALELVEAQPEAAGKAWLLVGAWGGLTMAIALNLFADLLGSMHLELL